MTWPRALQPTTPAPGTAYALAGRGLAPWFAAFGLGSVSQGVPFVLVTVELERSAAGSLWLAGVAVARLAPYLVVSPVAGTLAARVAPRLLFVSCAVARAAIASAIGVALVGDAPPIVPVVLLFMLVTSGCASYPALMHLVEAHAHKRPRGASLAAGVESAAFWAGPALGGALLTVGPAAATAVCVAMCAASALLAYSATTAHVSPASGSAGDVARESIRRLLGHTVRPAVVAVLALNGLAGFVTTLLVRLPADLGIGGTPEYGRLSIALGWGAVVAAVVAVVPSRVIARATIPLVCGGVAVVTLGTVPHLLTATLACAVLGASVMVSEMVAATQITTKIAAPLVAPVVGLLDAAMVAAMVVGAVAAPLALETTGTRTSVIVAGLAALAAASAAPTLPHRRALATTCRRNQPPVGATP